MQCKDLFEAESKGMRVDLSWDPMWGNASLNISTDFRDLTEPFNNNSFTSDEGYIKAAVHSIGKDDPNVQNKINDFVSFKKSTISQTEEEILQLTEAYRHMIFGLLVLADKKMKQEWDQVISNIPEEKINAELSKWKRR